ncbi:major facilitator superfamily domain containing 4B [Rhinolophus ferrumequinum]|uniref:Major facilitator superfamily domain containing 4B n=1 Tax=Rhinolophus ferrumequinum TaxID=59479 RepID=A0A7J7YSR4_RHIFE|nr:major facilitator superfamily domain containing 4B [Rhinolophus ferrumequinum]
MELRGAGAPAAGQRLLQADAPAGNEPEAVAGCGRRGGAGNRLRSFITVILCASFLGLGLSVAILGPTFQDLATNVNRNISSLSLIFVGRSFGYLSGSVIGGVLFDYMNHFLLLGVSLLATTIGLHLVPFCKTAVLLTVMMAVFGVSIGIMDTVVARFTPEVDHVLHPEQTAALVSSQYPHDSCLCVSFARSAQHGFSGAVLTPLWKPSLGDVQGVLLLLEASHSLTVPRTTFHLFCKPIWVLTKADGVREHGRFGATSLPRE